MSTSIGKLIYETSVQLNAGKWTKRGNGTYHLSPYISLFFMFHHRLGMQEGCVQGVMTGIRFCQQSLFLHQATLAAMASPSCPGCERKMFPVHPLDCWYSLALAAPHSKCFLTWKKRTFRRTLRHSPGRRLPGLRQPADMTEHGLSA